MLLKIFIVLCYHSFVMSQVNNNSVIKPPNREKYLCVSDNCLSKCCPQGMVYMKMPKKKSICVTGDDSILTQKQKVYQEFRLIDSVYLKDTNDILYGVACHKKHIVNHPFYLQQVQRDAVILLFLNVTEEKREAFGLHHAGQIIWYNKDGIRHSATIFKIYVEETSFTLEYSMSS